MMIDPALDPVNAWEISEPQPEPAISLTELVAALDREEKAATSEWERIRDAQHLALKYYEAKPFGNEIAGRSQIVLPDVQETVDYMAAAVLRTFVSGDRVVEFEATDEADEEAADEATAAIGFNFMRQQDGYRILLDWINSGLLERYGVVKTMMQTEERVTRETVIITDPVELEGFDGEVEGAEDNGDGTYTVNLKRIVREKRSIDVAVPAHEFRFSPRARHEDEADYLAHCPIKTRSDLVEMGFDRAQVDDLPAHTRVPDQFDDTYWADAESTKALEQVQLWEEYARIDIDGDGIAERVKVFRVDTQILRWADGELAIETVEEQPFAIFCPFPKPHRLVGYSLADKIMDVQLARSTVARQLFDGMYNANMPRPVIDTSIGMDENTIGDLLSPIPGSPIRAKGGSAAVQPFVTNFDIGKSMAVVEWMSREGQARSGAIRSAQVLDPNTLNEQSATEFAGNREDGQMKQEFIARNVAEPFGRLMLKKYRNLRREGEPFRAKIDGKYRVVDPAKWPEDINLTVRVGLGTGSKDKRIQARMALVPLLAEGSQLGEVTPKHRFNAIDGLVRDLGIGQGDDFWVDPDSPDAPEQPDRPDPEMAKVEAEAAKAERADQLKMAQLEVQREVQLADVGRKADIARWEAEQKAERELAARQAEAALAAERQAFDMQQAIQQAEFNREMARQQAAAKAEDDAALPKRRPGGDLDK